MNMGDDMIRLRKEADEADETEDEVYPRYNHSSDGIMDDHSGGMRPGELGVITGIKNTGKSDIRNIQHRMWTEVERERDQLKQDCKRHIKEKNQLGSKNDLLKKENAKLRYRLSSYEEGKKIIRNKIVNVIKKQA